MGLYTTLRLLFWFSGMPKRQIKRLSSISNLLVTTLFKKDIKTSNKGPSLCSSPVPHLKGTANVWEQSLGRVPPTSIHQLGSKIWGCLTFRSIRAEFSRCLSCGTFFWGFHANITNNRKPSGLACQTSKIIGRLRVKRRGFFEVLKVNQTCMRFWVISYYKVIWLVRDLWLINARVWMRVYKGSETSPFHEFCSLTFCYWGTRRDKM